MCKVYNTVGSLTTIKTHLKRNKIDGFHSVRELISFQNSYSAVREEIISSQRDLTSQEKQNLFSEISQLEGEIENRKIQIGEGLRSKIENLRHYADQLVQAKKSYIQEITYSFKVGYALLKSYCLKLFVNLIISNSVKDHIKVLANKRKRLLYLNSNFEDAIKEDCGVALSHLDRKKSVIDEINTSIYGAIGEQKVVNALAKLSDEHTLINDFTYAFTKGIYSKQDSQYIKSIQIDHLLVSPSGIFLIETKNWSKESLKNLSLHSPVQQIKRTNFALFKILSDRSEFKLGRHHWGERKIPIKNIIVLINHKPIEEFDHVKILTLDALLGYINYFKPCLSNQDVQDVSNYLVKINNAVG